MTAKRYYECHITMEADDADREVIKNRVEALKWKFSAIDGDIVLGGGVKFYATRHYNERMTASTVLELIHSVADQLPGVQRRKVEMVIYDDRSSSVRPCDGACIECHLDDLVGGSREHLEVTK